MITAGHLAIDEKNLKHISQRLFSLLANEYFLYTKTLNFHWNIAGENFMSLHEMLETQYEWLKQTIDDIAERIRTLGFLTPVDFHEYADQAIIDEGKESQTAQAMLGNLTSAHYKMIAMLRADIDIISKTNDYATVDFLTKLLGSHEKTAWMLCSHLKHKETQELANA